MNKNSQKPRNSSISGSAHRLRSTQPAPRLSASSSNGSSSESYTDRGARTNHNHVEKQYRNRLNEQFETLLEILPREEAGFTNDKRVSKAEVLILAKKYITDLEREKMHQEEENEQLQLAIMELNKKWVDMGGVCMP